MKKLYNRTALFHARAIVGLFALCLLALPSPALAQAIDLKLTNVTVKEAIEALNQRENYSVAIKSAGVDMQRRVSISAQNASIDEVLAQIFADQDITYTITGKSISVTKAAPKSLAADKNQLKGVVKDNLGLPVPGATIIVDGTNNGTTTMSNGDFSLENVKLPAKLVISFIGYQPRTVEVNSYAAIDITLVESSAAIDEVVVVGYGQQKRVNVTGAVGTISGKDLNNRPVTNTAAALQGCGRIGHGTVVEVLAADGAHGARDVHALLLAVADHDHLVDGRRAFHEGNVDGGVGVDFDRPGLVADERDDELRRKLDVLQREVAVAHRGGAVVGAVHDDRGTRNGQPQIVFHHAFELVLIRGEALRSCLGYGDAFARNRVGDVLIGEDLGQNLVDRRVLRRDADAALHVDAGRFDGHGVVLPLIEGFDGLLDRYIREFEVDRLRQSRAGKRQQAECEQTHDRTRMEKCGSIVKFFHRLKF